MTTRNELAQLLRAVARMLETMTEDEYSAFIESRGEVRPAHRSPKDAPRSKQKGAFSGDDARRLVDALRDATTRDEAATILEAVRAQTSRDDLARVAKRLSVHVTKQDTREMIEEKLVEVSVGARLRSQAIRAVNLKGPT